MKKNNPKTKLQFLTFAICIFLTNSLFSQSFYPKNFKDFYAINKTENETFVGIINEKYLNLKDFHALNDSVFATQNKEGIVVIHFKLKNPKFHEVSIDYFVDNVEKITNFLERTGNKAKKTVEDFYQKKSGFLEEESSDKKQYASILVEKDQMFLDKNMHKIQLTFKEKLIDADGKPYRWYASDHKLSEVYPLQNSVWYFDAKIMTEKKVNNQENDRITTTLYLSKSTKYPHKIKFLDDKNYIVTYNGEKIKTLKGIYRTNSSAIRSTSHQLIDVEFEIDPGFSPQPTANKAATKKDGLDELVKVESFSDKEITDFEVGSWEYLSEMFKFSYQLDLDGKTDIVLTHIDLIGGNFIPPSEMFPAPTKSKK